MKQFIKFLTIASALFLFAFLPAQALDDTPANRAAQADSYLDVVSPQTLMNDMAEKVSATIPEGQRATFKALLTKNLDIKAVSNLMRAAMIKNFSADELKALADFYGSPVGKSAMAKMSNYMADAMPPMIAELTKAKAITEQEMTVK